MLRYEQPVRAQAALLPPMQHSKVRPFNYPGVTQEAQLSHANPEASSSDAADGGSGLSIKDVMREQCVLLVCQLCQQGIVETFLDSTSADSICALVEAHDTFGRCAKWY